VGVLATALASLTLTFTAPGHAPKIGPSQNVGPHWRYTVKVTRAGKPVAARLTIQIVDPIGGAHAVDIGPSTKPITNLPIRGVYRDYMIFPPESRGVPLTIRVTAVAGGMRRVLTYVVTPHS
jgi:hypothetical protein